MKSVPHRGSGWDLIAVTQTGGSHSQHSGSHDYVVNGQGDDLPVLNRKCYKPSTREAIIEPI
jgi:hypothetical protein